MSARTGRQRRYGGNGPEVTSRAGSWEVREGVRCTRHRPSPCLQAAESLGGWGGRFGGGAGVFRRLARDEGRRIVWKEEGRIAQCRAVAAMAGQVR